METFIVLRVSIIFLALVTSPGTFRLYLTHSGPDYFIFL